MSPASKCIDSQLLQRVAAEHAANYLSARPFPHVVLDGLFPDSALDNILTEFRLPSQSWLCFDDPRGRKYATRNESDLGDFTRRFIAELNSSTFLCFLERLTGIDGLIPDPHLEGGGLHRIERGGFLKVHADFNVYERLRLDRRINLLLYLNRDWREEFGGSLELWNEDMSICEKQVLPTFNRCVVFSTADTTFHGHPEPLTCPADVSRKSLALYYYTSGRPAEQQSSPHTTLYRNRPGEAEILNEWRLSRFMRSLTPPIVIAMARRLRRRAT